MIISAFRRAEFVSDRMSYIILRGCWCNVVVLVVYTPCENKSNDIKRRFLTFGPQTPEVS
jgi:hypothetical protein